MDSADGPCRVGLLVLGATLMPDPADEPLFIRPDDPRCCCENDGLPYCGQPECDIYFCQDCGDEFNEPCARHVDTEYESG